MSNAADYVGIRGWCATVISITPRRKDGRVDYVVGEMRLLPQLKNRDVHLGGKDLSLDVFFHCYTENVAIKFFSEVRKNDTLIVSGDLSVRSYSKNEPSTNFWLDEFVVDESKHTIAPLSGRINVASEREYLTAANYRYNEECVFCGAGTSEILDEGRMFCMTCDQ